MSGRSPLDRLADLYGIEADYTDVWRKRHVVGDDSKRALLEAMNVAASGDAEVADSLAAAEASRRRRVAPPVSVLDSGASGFLNLNDVKGGGRFSWSLELENGDVHRGDTKVGDLTATGAGKSLSISGCRRLELGVDPPPGYHRLTLEGIGAEPVTTAIVAAPRRAFGVGNLGSANRLWGISAPLYGLRSGRSWGIGDFSDLGAVAEVAADAGAALLGLNPVHALFPELPERVSPYSPSSRLYLNALHIAIDDVPELRDSGPARSVLENASFVSELERARAGRQVDYPRIAALKRQVLEHLFQTFRETCGRGTPRREAFEAFVLDRGESLARHALFEALSGHFHAGDPRIDDWRDWPAPFQDPHSAEVAAFAAEQRDRIDFFKYLQWLAEDQLLSAQGRAKRVGMPVGLYLDLAVGVNPGGADSWADQDGIAQDANLGAPADHFNPNGQDWGLAPFNPRTLRDRAYAPFIDLLRANMRAAGALRIDHALGLSRSFWVPKGPPGGYVRYPFDDLLAVIRLESHRHECVVVGEDLGNVPDGFRDTQEASGLLGYRVLQFERDAGGAFRRAADYPQRAVASVSTHDLPTLVGYWAGRDIDWRDDLGLYPEAGQAGRERLSRAADREALLALLAAEGLLPSAVDPRSPPDGLPWSVTTAIHRFLGRTPCDIVLMQLIDALGAVEQENLPGTVDSYPNWRRRLPLTVEELGRDHRLHILAGIIAEARRTVRKDNAPQPGRQDIQGRI